MADTQVERLPGSERLPSSDVTGQASVVSNTSITDAHLDYLAREFPSGQYFPFCTAVGVGHNQANNLLVQFSNDHERAVRHVLAMWKDVTAEDCRVRLEGALQAANVGGLRYILDKTFSQGVGSPYLGQHVSAPRSVDTALRVHELTESNKAIQDLCLTQSTLTEDILELAKKRTEINTEVIKETERLADIANEIRSKSAELSARERERGARYNAEQLQMLTDELRFAKASQSELETALRRHTEVIKGLDDEIKRKIASKSDRLEFLRNSERNLKSALTLLDKDYKKKQSAADELDRRVEEGHRKKQNLKDVCSRLKGKIGEKKKIVTSLKVEEERLKKSVAKEKSDFERLKTQSAETQKELEDTTQRLQKKHNALEVARQVAEEKVLTTEGQLKELDSEVTRMEKLKLGLTKEIQEMKASISSQLKRADEHIQGK